MAEKHGGLCQINYVWRNPGQARVRENSPRSHMVPAVGAAQL
jgi:hypothetical protein